MEKQKNEQPNILLICADDLGWSDIGCYGSEINTPNIDKLAENGIRFTQFHNTSKSFPSRASLLTGLYAQECGFIKKHAHFKNSVTIGEILRTVGYRTLWSGKHHGLDNPYNRGFDRYYGLRDGCCNFFNPGNQRDGEEVPVKKRDRHWCIDSVTYYPYTPKEKDFYTTDYFTNYALDWLDEYKNEDKPFFLYMAYTAPHDPLMAWEEDIAKYEGKYMEGYEAIRKKRFEKQKKIGLLDQKYQLSEATYDAWEALSDSQKIIEDRKMAVYAAMIDRMDQNIGRILNKLDELGERKNTLILFVSDNGASAEVVNIETSTGKIGSMTYWTSLGKDWANVGNTPFRYYKNYSYEGGICTPFIAYWPEKIKNPGRISNFTGHFIDFMATFIDITGADYPKEFNGENIVPYQGQSFLPVFNNENLTRNKPIFWDWKDGSAMRDGKWKIVKHRPWDSPKTKSEIEWELYDMEKDPAEINNLALQNKELVSKMDSMYSTWIRKYDN